MAAPVVKWYDEANVSDMTQTGWDAGTVDAGDESEPITFLVWNNRGQASSDLSDMQETTITTKSYVPGTDPVSLAATGLNTGPVADKSQAAVNVMFFTALGWMSTGGLNTWEEVGGTDVAVVYAAGYDGPGGTIAAGRISGLRNSGDATQSLLNYAKVKLKLVAKPTASAGQIWWLTRISYKYV